MLLVPTRVIVIAGALQPLKLPLTQTVLTPGMNVLLAIWLAMSTRKVISVLAPCASPPAHNNAETNMTNLNLILPAFRSDPDPLQNSPYPRRNIHHAVVAVSDVRHCGRLYGNRRAIWRCLDRVNRLTRMTLL